MNQLQERFVEALASGPLFFQDGLYLKDGRPVPCFNNFGKFGTGRKARLLGQIFADILVNHSPIPISNVDALFGPSYKGSLVVGATAYTLDERYGMEIPFDYDRKEVKVHGDASGQEARLVTNSFPNPARITFIDDVMVSGGTKYDGLDKINAEAERIDAQWSVKSLLVGVDWQFTTPVYDHDVPSGLSDQELTLWKRKHVLEEKGEPATTSFSERTGIPVNSIVTLREAVDYLHQKRISVLINGERKLIDTQVKDNFDQCMEMYGIN
ncbi:MAG: hypothetical protein KKH52_03590 [Nanoarchaeota archaeon]|nr:hypothetical protein [Nanoarchaeota archaeon]MBU1623245.1 hypothetical protein [Nanoarchaeota archaeon]MBU1974450.1 hypothetical protein [Nanoarchaeota archaeon]